MNVKNKYAALAMVALYFLMVLPCYTTNAMANTNPYTYDISQGNITISAGTNSGTIKVCYGSGQTEDNISITQSITITDSSPSNETANYVTVDQNLGTLNITLENVNIYSNICPLFIGSGTMVNLTLSGTNILKAGKYCAGLGVPSGATLDITAYSTGSLTATGGIGGDSRGGISGGGSGIGGGGTVIINGGTVTATGGPSGIGCGAGSGIGGGGGGDRGLGGSGGTVTINGGTVTATGYGYGSSGIGSGGGGGGGGSSSGGTLTINGGSVNANSIQPTVQSSSGSQEYLVTISGLPGSAGVSYTVNGGSSVNCSTDASGNLYLWLPQTTGSATDEIQTTVTSSGAMYLATDQVSSSNPNNFTSYIVPSITGISPTSGPEAGGTTVTISGSGFTGATAVHFGSTTGSSITVTDDNSLTVTSPGGSGTVDVTVTGLYGTSAVVPSDQFTYVAPNQDQAAPTGLTGIAPTTAANNDGKITGVSDSMEYRLEGAAGFTSVAASATEITGLAAGMYQVRYEESTGFNAGAAVDVVVPAYIAQTFLSLGDSIAYGMSAAPGSDYVHLFNNHLLTEPAYSQLTLNNLAVSGDKSSDLLQRLLTPQYSAAVGNAKVITISIGGDNLLSPVIVSVCTAFGVDPVNNPNLMTQLAAAMAVNPNKDAILTSLANSPTLIQALQSGVSQFSTDFPQIITAVKTLSPQAQIYVLNLYNPFNEQDPLYSVFDPLIRGINQVLNNNAMAGYKVADVYTMFKTTPGAVNFNLTTIQLDPHPTMAGHAAIYQALLDAESGQVPASYYAVSIGALTGGSITASPTTATSGSAINLNITSNAGMQLQAGSLKYNDGSDHIITGTSFIMPAANVIVSAVFEPIPAGNYTVSIGTLSGGTITASPTSATSGSAITLIITPNTGMELQAGSLKYNDGSDHIITGTSFTMPAANVVVSAVFEPIPQTTSGGGGGRSSGGGSSSSGGTTVTGNVSYSNGTQGSNLTATVTTNSNGNYNVSLNAAQTVTLQQPDGTMSPLSDLSKVIFVSSSGSTVTVSANGTINLSNLAKGTDNQFKITYDLGNGQTITLGTLEVTVSSSGAVSLDCTLIDPYGVIIDAATGKPIAGANVTLYYANTDRNKAKGITPDIVVSLPGIDGFKPNNNQDPQTSDANGAYGFMVFPTTDYYIVASKDGYNQYASPIISVEQEIVKWDFKMNQIATGVTRLAGLSRVDTALAIAKASYSGTLSNVILATADNYPDALTGSVLAYKLNAPILLIGSSDADQEKVLDYLKSNLDPAGTVYILGGTAVVSSAMENKVISSGFAKITRLGGTDRYETSVKIADQLMVKSGTPLVLAYGENYPDALSISSIAAEMQYPILLVQKDGLSDAVKQEIAKMKPSKVYIIGGEGVISTAVANQVAQITSPDKTNIVRIAGEDRYETSLAVAKYFNLSGQSVCVATGDNFPDALAGSVYAANHNAPIILADGSLSDQVMNYLQTKKLTGAALFGGEVVVGKDIEQQLGQLMGK